MTYEAQKGRYGQEAHQLLLNEQFALLIIPTGLLTFSYLRHYGTVPSSLKYQKQSA